MKKINSIKDLKAEKKMLATRKVELEKAIRYDWLDVKNSLQPKNLVGGLVPSVKRYDEDSFLSSFAASVVAIAVKKVEEKMMKWLKRK